MIYQCCNENRKNAVLLNPAVNGIDFLEVLDKEEIALGGPRQQTLLIHCLNPLTQANWSPSNIVISGGESITQIGIDWVAPASNAPAALPAEQAYFASLADSAKVIVVRTRVAGDFSTYGLRLVNDAGQAATDPFTVTEVLAGFDPQLAEVDFSFKVECGPDFDCAPGASNCPPELSPPPPINYLAKDYGSFRSVILDRLNQLLPSWGGTSEADLGVILAELIAYVGDYLSYQQDAVATEAYLETARRRVSLRRHALLVDYHVHDGCNARAWIQLKLADDCPPGTPVFMDGTKTRFYTSAPGMPANLNVGSGNEEAALNVGVQVFEPMQDANLYPEHDTIQFYTWGDTNCCLPAGATEATLSGSFPNLQPGDVLIFEEVLGPQTGNAADADLRHRCAVRLTQVATVDARGNPLQDPLFDPSNPALLTEIQWAADDALPFPACVSSKFIASNGSETTVASVSVAHGNIVLADNGLSFTGINLGTVPQPTLFLPPNPASDRCAPVPAAPLPVRFRPVVPDSPLTQAGPLPMAGIPVTPGVVALTGIGYVSLMDSSGITSLLVQANDPSSWPQFIGIIVNKNASVPADIDLSVYYISGSAQILLEQYKNISLQSSDPNYAVSRVNALSQLIRVAAPSSPPVPAGFPTAPTMLPLSGAANLNDLGNQTFLTVQATQSLGWPALFGVLAEASLEGAGVFNLVVVYNPPAGGVGVNLPVTAGQYPGLTDATATGTLGLVKLKSFTDAPTADLSATDLMNFAADAAIPVITLQGPLEGVSNTWTPLQDLLESGAADPVFVVEVESDGTATLRFGDGTNGYSPDPGSAFTANYRVGNGTAGNVGAESLINLASPSALIESCRNPLPATGGVDPETNDQIRRRAPQAFLTQERAVTMSDYQTMAQTNPQVDRAVASLRWTGSWYTAFVAVEPVGAGALTQGLLTSLKQTLNQYRLAGQDLELNSPQYVSLEITLQICVAPDYFQSDVEEALLEVLSNKILSNGQKAVFYPDNFTFGQTVYLSPVYAAARSVAGVNTVVATVFQQQGVASNEFLKTGEMKLGQTQVARLENNPNYPNHGQLTLVLEGGKQ
ncbi:MAG TPA: putative baseplate assembly protein [Verrucomicrobiae bacterium]|nr:putative baseplate assembly protein [Verrucomicrobiae bacterium]